MGNSVNRVMCLGFSVVALDAQFQCFEADLIYWCIFRMNVNLVNVNVLQRPWNVHGRWETHCFGGWWGGTSQQTHLCEAAEDEVRSLKSVRLCFLRDQPQDITSLFKVTWILNLNRYTPCFLVFPGSTVKSVMWLLVGSLRFVNVKDLETSFVLPVLDRLRRLIRMFFHDRLTVGSAETLESGNELPTGLRIASVFSQSSWGRVGKYRLTSGCAVKRK